MQPALKYKRKPPKNQQPTAHWSGLGHHDLPRACVRNRVQRSYEKNLASNQETCCGGWKTSKRCTQQHSGMEQVVPRRRAEDLCVRLLFVDRETQAAQSFWQRMGTSGTYRDRQGAGKARESLRDSRARRQSAFCRGGHQAAGSLAARRQSHDRRSGHSSSSRHSTWPQRRH